MAVELLHKRNSSTGTVPSTSALELGEIAINTYDGKLFIKKDDGTQSIVTFDPSASSLAVQEVETVSVDFAKPEEIESEETVAKVEEVEEVEEVDKRAFLSDEA